MSRAAYLAALHAAFDARRDPLDDAAVRGWLAGHPEDLPEFAAMRAALAAAPITAPAAPPAAAPPRFFRWPMLFPPLAAAAALLLFLQTDRAPEPAAELEPSSTILAATSTVLVEPAIAVYQPVTGAGVLATSATHSRNSGF